MHLYGKNMRQQKSSRQNLNKLWTETKMTTTRASEIEDFRIVEAQKLGVVKIQRVKKYKNPNRWNKQLTPWFNE